MQRAIARFTKNDLAKYPFLKETAEYVKKLDFGIGDLANAEFAKIFERAEERIQEATLYTLVSRRLRYEDVEILSFPAAIMLTVVTESTFIQKKICIGRSQANV